jgi:hypothetical protein
MYFYNLNIIYYKYIYNLILLLKYNIFYNLNIIYYKYIYNLILLLKYNIFYNLNIINIFII